MAQKAAAKAYKGRGRGEGLWVVLHRAFSRTAPRMSPVSSPSMTFPFGEIRLHTGGRVYTTQGAQGRASSFRRRPDLEEARSDEPQFTSLGLAVARTLTIKVYESEPTGDDGTPQYEFFIDGKLAGAGMGQDQALQDVLLAAIAAAAGQADELPDN